MSIEWIDVRTRVPDNRRIVLVWGEDSLRWSRPNNSFLGSTRFNPSSNGGKFDAEAWNRWRILRVTHWAEINGPVEVEIVPPPKKPDGPPNSTFNCWDDIGSRD